MSDFPARERTASTGQGMSADHPAHFPSSEFRFTAHWRVFGTVFEVADVLRDVGEIPRWWPECGMAVETLDSGDRDGSSKVVCVYSIGLFQQTRLWQFRVVSAHYPWGFSIEAWGDSPGRGTWCFRQEGPWVDVTFDWTMRIDHPAACLLNRMLRPFLHLRFRWVMARGEEGLCLELARRRAASTRESVASSRSSRSTGATAARANLLGSRLRCEW